MSRRRCVLACLGALALVAALPFRVAAAAAPEGSRVPDTLVDKPAVASPPATSAEHVDGQVVVGFVDSMSTTAKDTALSTAGVEASTLGNAGSAIVVQTRPGQSVDAAVAALRARPGVRYAEPNYLWRTTSVPNDPRLGDQWGLRNTAQNVNGITGTADADIDALEAWDLTTGSADTVVAVVDSGIAYDHPDLAANMWINPGESGNGRETNGIDDDGNGYVDDWRGWDVVGASRASASDSDNDPRDILGHGTHVAGIIGAVGNNGAGVSGVAPNVKLMPVRVFDGEGVATSADIAEGFTYAAKMGARIVNYSGGGSSFSQAVQDAIDSHPNTLYIVAAGNDGRDLDQPGNDTYPCELPSPNIICVAATTQSDALAPFSNYSATSVDVAAPGTNILSTFPAFGSPALDETFETDPFAGPSARWTPGAAPGSVNTWARITSYTPGADPGSVTDSPPVGAQYPNNNDSWIQTTTPVNLAGQQGCRLQYPAYIDTETGFDYFYVSARADPSFTGNDVVRSWWGTGGINDLVDLSRFDGGPLYLRFGVFTDDTNTSDGVYLDDIRVTCTSTIYSGGGASELTYLSGTSMATPHVTGVAALVLSRAPSLSTAALRSAVVDTGDVLPGLAAASGFTVSGRRVNALAAVSAVADDSYHPLSPSRLVDTRLSSVVVRGGQLDVSVLGRGGVPGSGVGAVVLNVTAVDAVSSGYVTVWPGGEGRPGTSSLNFVAGQPVANLVVAKVGANGKVSLWNSDDSPLMGSVDLLVDLVGWFASGSSYHPLSPSRLVDTRLSSVVVRGGQLDVSVLGRGGVPGSGVGAVVLNVTAVDAVSSGYVTVWPGGEGRPGTSSLNFVAGQPVANLVVAKVGANGKVSLWNSDDSPLMGSVDLLVDLVGWFASGSSFTSLSPSRLVDTRLSSVVVRGGQLDVSVLGRGGVPGSGVGAVVLNVTAVDAVSSGYVTVWPGGEGRPGTSSLNFVAGQPVANLVVAKVGANGKVSLWNSDDSPLMGSVDLLVDLVGWFAK